VTLLGGLGLILFVFGKFDYLGWGGTSGWKQACSSRLQKWVLTPSQKAVGLYFAVVALLFLAQAALGGALAVLAYTAIGLAGHRRQDALSKVIDYSVLVPRAVPGLLAGLAFLWVFLFVPGLSGLRDTMVSIWLAYTVVWLAYGMRLISSALLQVGPELEEAARVTGADESRTRRDVTLPLVRFGMLASWVLIFMILSGNTPPGCTC
jgi:ABC-type Fe3+ transport system permease subunit